MIHDFEGNNVPGDYKALPTLLVDSDTPLYEGCNFFSKLGTTLALLRLKAESGISDVNFTKLLGLMGEMLPTNKVLPKITKEAKQVVCPMGLEVQKIHACVNKCILYRVMTIKICVHVPHARPHATSIRLQKTRTSRTMKSTHEFHSRLYGTCL